MKGLIIAGMLLISTVLTAQTYSYNYVSEYNSSGARLNTARENVVVTVSNSNKTLTLKLGSQGTWAMKYSLSYDEGYKVYKLYHQSSGEFKGVFTYKTGEEAIFRLQSGMIMGFKN